MQAVCRSCSIPQDVLIYKLHQSPIGPTSFVLIILVFTSCVGSYGMQCAYVDITLSFTMRLDIGKLVKQDAITQFFFLIFIG